MSLVSVIAPCYNGAKFLDRFFLSLLNQNYKDFNIFFVDDGSNDDTKSIAKKYEDIFKSNNIDFNYLHKENGGAASALNLAFKQKNLGKYLLIMDSDDELPFDSISKRVKFMEEHKDYGACTGYYKFIDNETMNVVCINKVKGVSKNTKKTLNNIILARGIVFSGYMCDKEKLFSLLENNQIYESKQGQNWQLLIPIASKYKIGVIPTVLYNYYIIKSSHSHSVPNSIESQMRRIEGLCDIQENVLDSISANKECYSTLKKYKYSFLINFAYRTKNKELMIECVKEYRKLGCLSIKAFIKYILVVLGK